MGGEAGLLAETPGLEGQGFETWRWLTAKYAPTGGQFEIDSLISLLNPKAAKDMAPWGNCKVRARLLAVREEER